MAASKHTPRMNVAVQNDAVPSRVRTALLFTTLAYLFVEGAFNARLIDVLGATSSKVASPEAVSGLEFWGRFLSAVAVALALSTLHIAQYFNGSAPFPFGLAYRRGINWTSREILLSLAIISAASITTYFAERYVVERSADEQGPATLWWAQYGARAADFAALGITYVQQDSKQVHNVEKSIAEYYEKQSINAPPIAFDDLEGADARTFIALFPHSSQNWARQYPRSKNDTRPYSPHEIQKSALAIFTDLLTTSTGPQSRAAILVPVRRCYELLYDQQPPFETEEPPFPLPSSRCLSGAAKVSAITAKLPADLAGAAANCFTAPLQQGERYADYVSMNCVYFAAISRAKVQADEQAMVYQQAYSEARARAIAIARNDPTRLSPEARYRVGEALQDMIIRATNNLNAAQSAGLFDPTTEFPPSCGRLAATLTNRLARHYDRASAQRWLNGREAAHCGNFDAVLPIAPGADAEADLYALQPDFAAQLAARGRFPDLNGRLPTVDALRAQTIDTLVAPVKAALDAAIRDQFSKTVDPSATPKVGDYDTLESFFSNPAVGNLARGSLQELSDSAFECIGISQSSGQVTFNGSLTYISDNWKTVFEEQTRRKLQSNGLATRFSGTLEDFRPGARCHAAGLSSYHRATIPSIALVISMIGLLFHAIKLIYYTAGLIRASVGMRLALGGAALAFFIWIPSMIDSRILRQPAVDQVITAYGKSHGSLYEESVRWLIKAEGLLYPTTHMLARDVFQPWGVTFDSRASEISVSQRTAKITRACAKVPQIAQTAEYEALESYLSSRTLCETG